MSLHHLRFIIRGPDVETPTLVRGFRVICRGVVRDDKPADDHDDLSRRERDDGSSNFIVRFRDTHARTTHAGRARSLRWTSRRLEPQWNTSNRHKVYPRILYLQFMCSQSTRYFVTI